MFNFRVMEDSFSETEMMTDCLMTLSHLFPFMNGLNYTNRKPMTFIFLMQLIDLFPEFI